MKKLNSRISILRFYYMYYEIIVINLQCDKYIRTKLKRKNEFFQVVSLTLKF
jgi:hypothetical protein